MDDAFHESRKKILSALNYVLSCNVIYMYFLDWNVFTLLLRALQLFCVYKGGKILVRGRAGLEGTSIVQKAIFLAVVILSNLPILLAHIFYGGVKPIILTFIGPSHVYAEPPLVLFLHDLFVMVLQTCMILNRQLLLQI